MIALFNNNMYDLNSFDFFTPAITNYNTRGHKISSYINDQISERFPSYKELWQLGMIYQTMW